MIRKDIDLDELLLRLFSGHFVNARVTIPAKATAVVLEARRLYKDEGLKLYLYTLHGFAQVAPVAKHVQDVNADTFDIVLEWLHLNLENRMTKTEFTDIMRIIRRYASDAFNK